MKFYHKKEVSLEETPILLRLERRHTLAAGSHDPDPERPLSRANSIGSFTGLGTPENAAPPIQKCRSEDKRSMLSRASTIVITENELASSLLYNNRKAKMQMEAANEAPTPVSSPQPSSTMMEVPIPSVRPTPRPKLSKTRNKGRSFCCSYVMIGLFICVASVGILMAIGGILYMELFSAYLSSNKESLSEKEPGQNALGEAEGKLLDSLYKDEKSSLEPNLKEDRDKPDPNLGLDEEINLKEETSFLEELGKALSDGKPSQNEATKEASNLDLSLNMRGLLNKAFLELPKELSKMLPTPPGLEKEQNQGGKGVDDILQTLEPQELDKGITIKNGSKTDLAKSSDIYVEEVENHSNENNKSDEVLINVKRKQEKEASDDDDINKAVPVSDIIKESTVSYVISNPDVNNHQELKSDDKQVQEIFIPFDHADEHAKENLISPDEFRINLTESTDYFENPILVKDPSHIRGNKNSSENNDITSNNVFNEDNPSKDSVPKSPITEVKSEDESKALPFEFFRRLGFDRDSIMSNPLLTVDDMNVKFSINEALKVLRSLDSNLPSSREKSTLKVPKSKFRPTVPVPKKVFDVGKERREYLLKLRRNMLVNLNRF